MGGVGKKVGMLTKTWMGEMLLQALAKILSACEYARSKPFS